MEPRLESVSQVPSAADRTADSPFLGPGLLARAGPFALVAVAAEASLALPPGTQAWTAVTVSLILLAVTGLAFLLPWDRLPAWTSVLVPLAYLGSALALTLAAGTTSGVGIVVLIPLVWTALFHRRWESACLVAAVVAGEVVVSLVQSVPDAVIVRRVLLWGVLGALLAVATHGLRDRITRSQQVTERLQERIGELMVIQDRDRLAADLQGSVVQRIFAAGLKLQGALPLAGHPELRQRITSCVDDLDNAVRLLRHAIFGLENRVDTNGLRHEVLQLCIGASPVPEIAFAGPVDEILSPGVAGRLLDLLGLALGSIGTHSEQTSVLVEAGESLSVIVTGTGTGTGTGHESPAGVAVAAARDFAPLRERAGQDDIAVEVTSAADGIRLAWSLPLGAEH